MVDGDRLSDLLSRLGHRADELAAMCHEHGAEGIAGSHDLLDLAKWRLFEATQLCLDIGNHVIASERLGTAKVYADIPVRLAEAGWLAADLAEDLEAMPRFRNRLVHFDTTLDDTQTARIAGEQSATFHRFRRAIAQRLLADDAE